MKTWTMQMKQNVPMLSLVLGVLLLAIGGLQAQDAAGQVTVGAQGVVLEPGKPVEVTLPTPGTVVVTPPAMVGEGVQTQRVTVEVQTVVPPPQPPLVTKAVLVVQNHAQAEYRDFLSGMADLLTTELSNRNFQIIKNLFHRRNTAVANHIFNVNCHYKSGFNRSEINSIFVLPCLVGFPSKLTPTKIIFSMVMMVCRVIILRTSQVKVIDVFPNSVASIPISIISP